MHVATAIKQSAAHAGIEFRWPMFFSSRRKDGTTRCKLWLEAGVIFNASQATQRKMDAELRKLLGNRFISAYFIDSSNRHYEAKSFCVVTKSLPAKPPVDKRDPFRIPLMFYGRVSKGTAAVIDEMTPTRVVGVLHNGSDRRPFDVKHNGEGFAVGMGSGNMRFYFKNWDKK